MGVACFVNDTHAAVAKFLEDLEVAKDIAGHDPIKCTSEVPARRLHSDGAAPGNSHARLTDPVVPVPVIH